MESTPDPSPLVKHESISESYPSLFSPEPSTPATMDPSNLFSASSMSPGAFDSPSPEPEESGDKKPTKKRKSWGQVLPEPKTNLPPRKRAKTEDEKEQRRVERVLRNRRAAQSSRERKRQETEALAQKNKDLEAAVLELQRANAMLQDELKKVRPDLGGAAPNSNSMTLSQPLFPSHEFHGLSTQPSEASMNLIEELVNKSSQTPKTINPASISPALTPVPEEPEFELEDPVAEELPAAAPRAVEATQANTSTHPMTQYPAAVLLTNSISISPSTPTKSSTSTSGSSPTHLKTENPADSTTNSSTSQASKTLRLRTLRKILTCNRQLARPLQDATLEVLRLSLTRGRGYRGSDGHDESVSDGSSASLPSPERLIALLWAIRTTVKGLEIKDQVSKQGKEVKTPIATKGPRAASTKTIVFLSDKLAGSKRKRDSSLEEKANGVIGKRIRDRRPS
ncbi:hypothetical protein VSDG_05660 [Cytospora chrysosperma]|uniref:BZIP domain-containing protein n=1 Tax=Cytospora chrysosperma TaxID=252740 RepID=A0A423VT63_CYTCH|nr:hypothetical protein VSDG_05660 [Valsa sordida]